ncbi:hypothetical protein AB0G79_24910 [Streptomyces sp. NPDC020807]|uniref:hypothetical protein n=1 Tax=Streptomyces sp. NPDC020807 TaxID=3155119 RepID=UPI003410C70D
MVPIRALAAVPLAVVPLAVVTLALSGCSLAWSCTDTTAKRGKAGTSVQVENTSGRPVGVTAEVVGWRLDPHPQVPSEGDKVRFQYRFRGADEWSDSAVEACAVDGERRVLGCMTVHSSTAWPRPDGDRTGDDWLSVQRPERVAAVLLIPNDQSYRGRSCEADVKDGGGTHPPEPAGMGDRL